MKIISVFNNKGGVGKTTLTFHLAHALGEMGYRVLLMDLDPQCNLTILSLDMEAIHDIWAIEDAFIDDFDAARKATSKETYGRALSELKVNSLPFEADRGWHGRACAAATPCQTWS
jgi:cellulose biosynthesis protein BcsQ